MAQFDSSRNLSASTWLGLETPLLDPFAYIFSHPELLRWIILKPDSKRLDRHIQRRLQDEQADREA